MIIEMRHPALAQAVPLLIGVVVLLGGAVQFTAWKSYHLSSCTKEPGGRHIQPGDMFAAWRHGLRLGFHCVCCSAGLTAILLVVGVMDLRMMAVITAAMTVERLAPSGEHVARVIGMLVITAGLFLVMRAVLPGLSLCPSRMLPVDAVVRC
jgi:predicted metal-binding membrane protein